VSAYVDALDARRPLEVQYPHCDWRVLHAPGECRYCDGHPDWQAERVAERVTFTDDPRNRDLVEQFLLTGFPCGVDGWRACSGYAARGERIKVWGGNAPRPPA
jgi:hypothetical protein